MSGTVLYVSASFSASRLGRGPSYDPGGAPSAHLVFSYTRAGAIGDGALIEVTEHAHEAGFRIPVSVTAAAWADCVEWPEAKPDPGRERKAVGSGIPGGGRWPPGPRRGERESHHL
ncbi:DUF6573 family protein [Tahibacter aquaticus]|uniref:DUF6573 family protein n=1 Tax=Tahibacter aquaticus TaxID=520092 RepID=UPI003CE5A93A